MYNAGVYESFDTICIYLENDQSAGTDVDNNFWVKYKMGILNQKNPAKSVWKESSICTKSWNNSVLQFMKVSDMLEADAGFLVRDTVVFVCEILDCCPWFEFSDLEVSLCLMLYIYLLQHALLPSLMQTWRPFNLTLCILCFAHSFARSWLQMMTKMP